MAGVSLSNEFCTNFSVCFPFGNSHVVRVQILSFHRSSANILSSVFLRRPCVLYTSMCILEGIARNKRDYEATPT